MGDPDPPSPYYLTGPQLCRDQRFSNALIRALSNPITTLPSTTNAGAERTPRSNSSSRASSSIMMSFMANSTPLLVRYSASAVQGPQRGCENIVIFCSLIIASLCFCLPEAAAIYPWGQDGCDTKYNPTAPHHPKLRCCAPHEMAFQGTTGLCYCACLAFCSRAFCSNSCRLASASSEMKGCSSVMNFSIHALLSVHT